jgi:hypothetical protein
MINLITSAISDGSVIAGGAIIIGLWAFRACYRRAFPKQTKIWR